MGAVLRYAVVRLLAGSSLAFPYSVLVVNVLGSLLLGFFTTWIMHKTAFEVELRLAIQVGLLGAFTTFSTFSLDTLQLASSGQSAKALINIALNLTLCLIGVWLGVAAAQQLR